MKLVAALALLATYAFFYEYLPPLKRVHIYSDIEGFHFPLQQYAFQALKQGRLPQWDPSMYCGIPFSGNVQAALFYPPTWLMYAARWRRSRLSFRMLEYYAFAHIWLAFVLCYQWLRARPLARLASALGSAVFAYGGYMVAQMVHLGVLAGMVWMPLALWGIDEAVSRRDWRPLWKTALASALCFLAGYPPTWVAFCATAFVYALASRAHWRAAAGVSAAVAASLLLAMVQFWPAIEAAGFMVPDEKYGGGVTRWRALVPFFVPNWFDFNRGAPPFPADTGYYYFGLATMFAIAWAVGRRNFRPYAQPVAAGAFCLLMAANPHFLVYRAMAYLPLLKRIAQSGNFYEGIAIMAALVTAIALNDFLERAPRKPLPRWWMPASVALLLGWSARLLWVAIDGGKFPAGVQALAQTAVALVLFSLALWTLAAQSGVRRTVLTAALLLAAGIDYKVFGTNRQFNTIDGNVDQTDDANGIHGVNDVAYRAVFANRNYRIASDEQGSPGVTDFRRWGLATAQGFDPFLSVEYHEVIERWVHFETNREFHMDLENGEMLRALGVRYVITHEGVGSDPRLAVSPNYRLVGPDDSFYRIYEYQHAQPPYGWEDGSGEVVPTAWMPERRSFRAHSESGGRFVFVEQFYPGWIATVDGHPTPIERWNGAFQAIQTTPGEHTILFEYHARSLLPGAFVSLASLAALIAIASIRSSTRSG
jgi:hypothetical protein